MTIEILVSNAVPDGTYFRTADAEPEIDNETQSITVLDGRGTRRSWGTPGVTSTIILDTLDVVAIHVGFHHKHGGGQFWRFVSINGALEFVPWKSLDDDMRQAILDAAATRAPSWARLPGKLRKNYLTGRPKSNLFTAYKICGIDDAGQLTSLYDPEIVYELYRVNVQAARPGHGGGWYVHPHQDRLKQLYESGDLVDRRAERAALVQCECWGNTVEYSSGKIGVTYCKPISIIEEF